MADRAPSLRASLSATTAVLTLLALAVVAALLILTARLERAGAALGAAVESVRLAEEAQIELLLHARAADPLMRRQLESGIRARLRDASAFVTTEAEAALLADAVARLDEYVGAAGGPREAHAQAMEAAYGAIESLADVNVAQSRTAQEDIAAWARFARGIGLTAAGSLVLLAASLAWWLNTRAFQPVFSLARVMQDFGSGDRAVRAVERGPAELREMAGRFNEMASALAAQREAQMAFLAGVAHDLRGPLSTLRVALAVAAPDRPLGTEDQVRRTLALVSRQIVRLERMVGDFLDRARIEAGRLELEMADCDLRSVVEAVSELFRSASPKHHVEVEMPAAAVVARCDALRIEQVVTNLVSNAIKYSPDGGTVTVRLDSGAAGAEIEVADEGIGITEKDQQRLFEPFRRVGDARAAIPGVGLGLFVVRQIIAAHGGEVEVASAPGRGATFRIRLPPHPSPAGSG